MNIGILTVSDKGSRGERVDRSGPAIVTWAGKVFPGARLISRIVPDDRAVISGILSSLADEENCRLIITTGGTGFAERDVTPEATQAVIQREAPGLSELIRSEGLKKTPFAALSRAIAGIRGMTLIINLPGSEKAVNEGLQAIEPVIPHALELIEKGGLECGR